MKKKTPKNTLLMLFSIYSQMIFAGDVLPEFTGYYTYLYLIDNKYDKKINLDDLSDKNACYINEHIDKSRDYRIKIQGEINSLVHYATKLDAASILNGNSTHYEKCIFLKLEEVNPFFFIDYPGSYNEVNDSLKNTPMYAASYNCYKSQSDNYPEIKTIEFMPIYQCPDGYTSKGIQDGCVKNEKLICPGDVLGRDLDVNDNLPTFIKKQGHVGLVNPEFDYVNDRLFISSNVVEMLNVDHHFLNMTTISEFKNKVSNGFWGSKYETINHPHEMTVSEYLSIKKKLNYIKNGYIKYTLTWQYHPRFTKSIYLYNPFGNNPKHVDITYPSLFRCDTLVKYLYEEGAKIKLDLGYFFTPKDLYESMLNKRSSSDSQYYQKGQIATKYLNIVESCNGDFTELKQKITNKMNPATYQELMELDVCMKSFHQVQGNEDEKVNFLWALYEKNKKSYISDYLIDSLAEYQTLRLSYKIIDEIKENRVTRLYDLLLNNITFDTEDQINKLTNNDIEVIKHIYEFIGFDENYFKNKLRHPNLISVGSAKLKLN